jgi:hypothetical protein
MPTQTTDDTMKWIRRGSAIAVLLIGWAFILFVNNFHVTTPVVVVGLGYFATVAAIYTLFRTGATAVTANDEDDDDASWGKPLGALAELEREKRTLLKAIKEAEFDHQMGKLSKADADAMIAVYRARAIEVIKEIDVANSTSGTTGSVRDQILREARARLQLEGKSAKPAAAKAAKAEPAAGGGSKKRDRAAERQKRRAERAADRAAAAVVTAKDKPSDEPAATAATDKTSDESDVASSETASSTASTSDAPKSDAPSSSASASDAASSSGSSASKADGSSSTTRGDGAADGPAASTGDNATASKEAAR